MGLGKSKEFKLHKRTIGILDFEGEQSTDNELLCNQVFSNSVVTDCIFHHLPTADILNCSVVSTTWNIFARTYVRKRRKCYCQLFLRSIPQLKKTLKLFQNGISKNNHPFYGTIFYISHITDVCKTQSVRSKSRVREVKDLLDRILKLVPLKHIAIMYCSTHVNNFLSEILFPLFCGRDIQTLCFKNTEHFLEQKYCFNIWLKNVELNGLSSLKSIDEWELSDPNSDLNGEHCEALLRTCPDLHEILLWVAPAGIMEFEKYNKLFLIKKLKLTGSDIGEFKLKDLFTSGKAYNFRVEELLFSSDGDCRREMELLYKLLQSSSESLQRLKLKLSVRHDLNLFDSVSKINMPPMTFAKEVEIAIAGVDLGQEDNSAFAKHPLKAKILKTFPNAKNIYSKCVLNPCTRTSPNVIWLEAGAIPLPELLGKDYNNPRLG